MAKAPRRKRIKFNNLDELVDFLADDVLSLTPDDIREHINGKRIFKSWIQSNAAVERQLATLKRSMDAVVLQLAEKHEQTEEEIRRRIEGGEFKGQKVPLIDEEGQQLVGRVKGGGEAPLSKQLGPLAKGIALTKAEEPTEFLKKLALEDVKTYENIKTLYVELNNYYHPNDPLELGHTDITVLSVFLDVQFRASEKRVQEDPSVAAKEKIFQQEIKKLIEILKDSQEWYKPPQQKYGDVLDIINKIINGEQEITITVGESFDAAAGAKGSLKLEWQPSSLNQGISGLEKAVGKLFNDLLNNVIGTRLDEVMTSKSFSQQRLGLKNSPSFLDQLENLYIDLIDPKRNPRKVVVRKKSGKKFKSKNKKYKATKFPVGAIRPPIDALKPTRQTSLRTAKVPQGKRLDLLQLKNIINTRLPPTVQKNMGPPGLINRTGRFAYSTEVVDITTTPKGFPSIGYTYDTSRYGIFEPGRGKRPWASDARDPRKVIDRSVREIAQDLVIGRLYTRRVV